MEHDKEEINSQIIGETLPGIHWAGIQVPQYKVPRDPHDSHYILAFNVEEEEKISAFFQHYGFVVVQKVLTREQAQATIDDIYSLLEVERKFDRTKPQTWSKWPSAGMAKHGMPTRKPVFTKNVLNNRQNPNIHRVFSTLFKTTDLLVNHDRVCLLRPTKDVTINNIIQDKPEWKSAGGVHLDMDPWGYLNSEENKTEEVLTTLQYDGQHANHFIFENNQVHSSTQNGLHLQAVLNLEDNYEEDGGFVCVPGFCHHFAEWCKVNQGSQYEATARERNSLPFAANEAIYQLAIRISMRQGSMVIWDQRTPHGGFSNNSGRMRVAQFLKMFPAQPMHPERARRRAAAIATHVRAAGLQLTPTGRQVFGLADNTTEASNTAPQSAGRGNPKPDGKRGGRNRRI